MLLQNSLYILALILTTYLILHITSTGKATISDAIAALGVIISIILALSLPSSSPKGSTENTIRDTTIIAGDWEGTIIGDTSDFSAELNISIETGCSIGSNCGTFSIPKTSCSGNLKLLEVSYKTFYFVEDSCGHGSHQITLFSNGILSWIYQAGSEKSHATLNKK